MKYLFENQCKINLEILYDKRSVLDLVGTCHNFRDEAKVQTSLLAVSEDGALRGWILNGDKEEETHQWRNLMIENNQMKRAKVRFQIDIPYSSFSNREEASHWSNNILKA